MTELSRDTFTGLFTKNPLTLGDNEIALINAIRYGETDDVREMLKKGSVDVNASMGLPMIIAALAENFPIAQTLSAHGASFEMAIKTAESHAKYYLNIYQSARVDSPKEKEASTAWQQWTNIHSKAGRFYAADQELLKKASTRTLDDIAEQLRQLNETIRDITKPRTISKEISTAPIFGKKAP